MSGIRKKKEGSFSTVCAAEKPVSAFGGCFGHLAALEL